MNGILEKKSALCCATLALAAAIMPLKASSQSSFSIMPESHLAIEGKSNLNSFRYEYMELGAVFAKLPTVEPGNARERLLEAALPLALSAFDSGHRKMNRDFRSLLQADRHPSIVVSISDLQGLRIDGHPTDFSNSDASTIEVQANFTIAGQTRHYCFPVAIRRTEEKLALNGRIEIDIEDFGLEAPSALFGLIQVRNRIHITFEFIVAISGSAETQKRV